MLDWRIKTERHETQTAVLMGRLLLGRLETALRHSILFGRSRVLFMSRARRKSDQHALAYCLQD